MEKRLVLLKVKPYFQEGFIKMFCYAKEELKIGNEDNIIGVAVVKEEMDFLHTNELLVLVDNVSDLPKEELVKSFMIAPDEHLKLEMFPLECNPALITGINSNSIIVIPFDTVIEEYKKYINDKKNRMIMRHKSSELAKLIKVYIDNIDLEEQNNKVLEKFGFDENDNVDLYDLIEFASYFGFNKELYKVLNPVKQEAQVTWKQMRKLKWGDIDFIKKTISFAEKVKKTDKVR